MHGPEDSVREIGERLDWISDLYLSVGIPIQRALPKLGKTVSGMTTMIRDRIRENHRFLKGIAGSRIRYVPNGGGWSAILRLPNSFNEEKFVLELIREKGVVAHPGYFFDLPFKSSLVLSLLPEPALFRKGIDKIRSVVEES